MHDIKKEFEFYVANKAEFLAKFRDKFIVLKNQTVIGAYDDRMTAIREASQANELGSFLVQHVTDVDEQVRFHSRYAR